MSALFFVSFQATGRDSIQELSTGNAEKLWEDLAKGELITVLP